MKQTAGQSRFVPASLVVGVILGLGAVGAAWRLLDSAPAHETTSAASPITHIPAEMRGDFAKGETASARADAARSASAGFHAALARGDETGAAAALELWLQNDEAGALAAAAALPFERTRFGTLLFTELSAHFDRQPARPALEKILAGLTGNQELLAALAKDRYREFARVELDDSLAWLGARPAEERALAVVLADELGASQRSNGALDPLLLPARLPAELRAACLRGVLDARIEVVPWEATEALLKLPRAPEVEQVLAVAVTRLARTRGRLAMEAAETIQDEDLRARALAEAGEVWALREPAAFQAWSESVR